VQVGLGYQFVRSGFMHQEREDEFYLILGKLTDAAAKNSQIDVQGGVSLRGSSDPSIDFDHIFFSFTYSVELGKF